jgi:hypothetical protein
MKRFKKILKWSAISLVSLILLLVFLGYLFEDRIHLYAIKELGKALNARIEVRETNVSFLRSWPSVRVELTGLTINPVGSHASQDAISVESARLTINFWSMFSDKYEVSKVRLDQPHVWMEHNKEGELNFMDMFQPKSEGEEEADSSQVSFALRQLSIAGGDFRYRDLRSNEHIHLDSIYLGLDGDFSAEHSEIESGFAVHIDNWYNGRISLFKDKHINATALIDAAFGKEATFKLREGKLAVAAVNLDLKGGLGREGKAYRIDLDFATNESSFKSFLSLLPGGLLDTGREYTFGGDFSAKGYVRGRFGASESPNIHVDYNVARGSFQYVGYDAKLTDVAMNGVFHWESKRPIMSEFKVNDFQAQLGAQAVSGVFSYTDFSDPLVELKLKGGIGLEDLRDFYPAFADSSDLRGLVRTDIALQGRLAAFKEKRYRDIRALGTISFDSIRIADPRLQNPVERLVGNVVLNNQMLQVNRLAGKIGSSDFDIKGTVTEYLSWFLEDSAQISGLIELKAQRLNADEWFHEGTASKENSAAPEKFVFKFPAGLDFQARMDVAEFKIAKFEAKNVKGICKLKGQELTLESLTMQALQGDMEVSGSVLAEREDRCKVSMNAVVINLDINTAFKTFDQLAAFSLVKDHLFGRYTGNVSLRGAIDSNLDLDPASLLSFGSVTLAQAKLINFEPLEGLAGFVKLEDLRFIEFSDVNTSYLIEDQFFYIPKMKVKANRYNLEVSGRHGFDNSLDYKVLVELPRNEAKRSRNQKVLEYIDAEQPDPLRVIIPVRITGTVDAPKYALEGEYVAAKMEAAVQKQGDDLKTGWKQESEALFGAKKDTFEVDDLIDVKKPVKDSSHKGVFDKLKSPLKNIKLPKQLGGQK